MKKVIIKGAVLAVILAVFPAAGIGAQSLKGMSLNGATGLYSIPTGRIGWEETSDFGLDFGYHAVIKDKAAHIPAISASLFQFVELSGAFDFQPGENETDIITGLKIQLPLEASAIAIGGNFQVINLGNEEEWARYNAGQAYVAVTYAGEFFSMPAETTVVIGKTFMENNIDNSNIDFGMGFDLVLLPDVFQNIMHWILDFSNFSYSTDAFGADSWGRGVLNTGIRIDLSVIPVFKKFKFSVDVMITDAFDEGRAFSAGAVFGIPVL